MDKIEIVRKALKEIVNAVRNPESNVARIHRGRGNILLMGQTAETVAAMRHLLSRGLEELTPTHLPNAFTHIYSIGSNGLARSARRVEMDNGNVRTIANLDMARDFEAPAKSIVLRCNTTAGDHTDGLMKTLEALSGDESALSRIADRMHTTHIQTLGEVTQSTGLLRNTLNTSVAATPSQTTGNTSLAAHFRETIANSPRLGSSSPLEAGMAEKLEKAGYQLTR